MNSELKKRRKYPEVEIQNAAKFSNICLDEVSFDSMREIPKYVVSDEVYVVPQERSNPNQSGLARVCVSQSVSMNEDEILAILNGEQLFEGTEIFVLDGEIVDEQRNERIFSVLSMEW